MVILCVTTLIEAIMTQTLNTKLFSFDTLSKVTMTLYQLSSVFEAGVSVACLVTLHNWFNEKNLGVVTSIWFAALYA